MVKIRRARLADVPRMMPLLQEYANQAEILPRSEQDVCRSIREWVVAEAGDEIVGMGSLLIMGLDLAEIRSLVIKEGYQGQGIGREMMELLLQEAMALDIGRVFALTRKPGFFLKLGFGLTRIEALPQKVRHDCVFCPKFQRCDEVALITYLKPDATAALIPQLQSEARNGSGEGMIIPLAVAAQTK